MPHIVVLYSANLEAQADMSRFCRAAADALMAVCDEAGKPVFPTGGIRVFAYPAAHAAVSDGSDDHGFVYVNLRMAAGRGAAAHQAAGAALGGAASEHFAPLLSRHKLGLTVQIDEGHEVFDARLGNLHPLFGPR